MTLDTGTCPRWLFERMVKLGREMVRVIIAEYGPDEFIRRMGDPVWFQTLGTVLAFDWNASGLTTILTAALKEAIREKFRNTDFAHQHQAMADSLYLMAVSVQGGPGNLARLDMKRL